MDPLRCGAGEAGAFHPLWKLWKQYEQKPFAPAFPVRAGLEWETRFGDQLSKRATVLVTPGIAGKAGVELTLWAR